MGLDVHIIPVGFDFERLSQPISKGNLDADRVRLLAGVGDDSSGEVQTLVDRMLEQLLFTFDRMLGIEVEHEDISDIYGFEDIYVKAYEMISEEVGKGNRVWINISSMPRTVGFAFATAANSIIVEDPNLRDDIHTYYVPPEDYLVVDMIQVLRETRETLVEAVDDDDSGPLSDQLESIEELIDDIDSSGVTKGARKMNGGLHVEFPAVASGELREFEEEIIQFLQDEGSMQSTSALARELAAVMGEEADDAFRSKVQYNVTRLEEKGYINRIEGENSYETRLSTMGTLWARTHL